MFDFALVIFEFLEDPSEIMLEFGALEFELLHVVVEHFDSIFDFIVGEVLKALGDFCDAETFAHF